MNDNELYKIKNRAKKADELTKSINEINVIIDKLVSNGKIHEIKISYWGKSTGGFGAEAGEIVEKIMSVDSSTLNIKKEEFSNAFSNAVYNSLEVLKTKLSKEYKDL